MVKNINVHGLVFLCFFLSANSSHASVEENKKIASDAISGIIKAAGKYSVGTVCKLTLPAVLCEVLIEPVISSLYEEMPSLRPNDDDSLMELRQKADMSVAYLEKNKKMQELIVAGLAKIKDKQSEILSQVLMLGKSQNQIKRNIELLIREQEKNKLNILLRSKNDARIGYYKLVWMLDKVDNNFHMYDVGFERLRVTMQNANLSGTKSERYVENIIDRLRKSKSIIIDFVDRVKIAMPELKSQVENEELDIDKAEKLRVASMKLVIMVEQVIELQLGDLKQLEGTEQDINIGLTRPSK